MGAPLYAERYRRPRTALVIPLPVAARAAKRWKPGTGECWISTYSVASHGYAQIGWQDDDGRMRGTTAHRAAWVYHNDLQVPAGHTIDHTCKNRTCVNPDHLRALPNYENARRTAGADWELGKCKNGHSNDELRLVDGGRRVKCGICNAEAKSRYQQRQKATRGLP